jgi:hypothetical protein
VPKPNSDLERYLAGEFAEEQDFLSLGPEEGEPEAGEETDACPLRRLLAPFTRKGS